MADNFYDTAKRMEKASKNLHNHKLYHNACYLAGYVVECYTKIIINITSGNPPMHHNLADLNRRLKILLSILYTGGRGRRRINPKYILKINTHFPNLVGGHKAWNPTNRYIETPNEWTENDSIAFQNEMIRALRIITKMKNDGII